MEPFENLKKNNSSSAKNQLYFIVQRKISRKGLTSFKKWFSRIKQEMWIEKIIHMQGFHV